MLKSVLFDLDGVLIDTEGVYSEFWSSIDRRFPTGVENFAEVIKGSTLAKILGENFPDPEVREKVRQLLVEQEDNMVYRPFPGALDLLRHLRHEGLTTAIVTSSNRVKIAHLLEQVPELGELVDVIITDEDVTRSKPSPQGYLKAAGDLGCLPGQFVVVEDSFNGLEAGRRAGAHVVGLWTTNSEAEVKACSDEAFADIQGLLEEKVKG